MRSKSRTVKSWLTRLLVAATIAVPIQFVTFTQPAQAVDAPGSIYFDGASGNTSLGTTLAESPGTGDLTYEFWYKQTESIGNQLIFSTQSSSNASDGFEFRKNGGNVEVWSGGNYLGGSGIDYMDLNVWYHFVLMRVGTTNWMIYRSGAARAWFSLNTTTSTNLTFGATTGSSFRGKIANFRYSKSALYSDPKFANFLKNEARFTVPLTAQAPTPETKVLLNTLQGANFASDTSASPNTFTLSATNPPTSSTDTPLPIYAGFLSNGGSGSMSNQVSNVSANLSTNTFTKSGSTFIGWNTEAGGTSDFYMNGATYGFTSSITLYAQWSSDSVPVNFNTDGGSFVAGSSVVIGSAIQSAPTAPTKAGYTFGGWKATAGGSAVTFPYYPILSTGYAASVTSAALVDLGRYENKGTWVSSTWYGPNRGTTPNSTRDFATYTDGRKYIAIRESNNSVLLNPTRLDGYYMVPLDSSTTLTAIWTASSNAVTYSLGGADGIPPTQANVNTAATFTTAAAPTRAGYAFAGWNNGASNTAANTSYTMGNSPVTLTAQWTANAHQITYDLDGGESITPISSSANTGDQIVLPSSPVRFGFTFGGWSDGQGAPRAQNSNYTVGIGDVAITAVWTRNIYSLTFDSQRGASVSGETFGVSDSITRPTDPTKYGYKFLGWSTTSSGQVVRFPYVPVSLNNTILYAQWVQKSLSGINTAQLVNPTVITPNGTDQTLISTRAASGNVARTRTIINYYDGALPSSYDVSVYTLPDNTFATEQLGSDKSYIISQVVAWKDRVNGDVTDTVVRKEIEMTIESTEIKSGAKVYAIVDGVSTLLATATTDGSVTVKFATDPVIVVAAAPAAPPSPPSSGGAGGTSSLQTPTPTPTPVPVITLAKSFNILGFNPGSWQLTKSIKKSIDAFFKSNTKPNKISCVGYTTGPTVLSGDAKLAVRRGQEVCRYIGVKNPTIAHVITKGTTTKNSSDYYRRTKVTVTN